MFGTVEGTHGKIIEKINKVRQSLIALGDISERLRECFSGTSRKCTENKATIDNTHINDIIDNVDTYESNYNLAVASVLSKYYTDPLSESANTRNYYRIITSENCVGAINDIAARARGIIGVLSRVSSSRILPKETSTLIQSQLTATGKTIDYAISIDINIILEYRNYEICKCGSRMTVLPELSELHCADNTCGRVKRVIGTVFRDDQFYPQDGQKTKHGGYDESRHYRFWIERLQARESKAFREQDLDCIGYVIKRDGYNRRDITCEVMRSILKDPHVNATCLNDHAPLLVKMFGGIAPPQLNFQENRLCSIRFNKAMVLYDTVNPDGGNKPYYPYFIYKILEEMFKNTPEKLRLLDYIHLQSRETVIKNDKYYEQMCGLSDDEGLVYRPTDPAGRL